MPKRSDWPALPRQLSFEGGFFAPGLPVAPAGNTLFLALKPPGDLAAAIHEAAERHCRLTSSRCRPHPAAALHVSVLGLGRYDEVPPRLVHLVDEAAGRLAVCPFQIGFPRSEHFGGHRKHLVLTTLGDASGILELRRQLVAGIGRRAGMRFATTGFTPHLTLVYDCGSTPPMAIERPISWLVEDIVLVLSIRGETRHEELGRWKLDPAARPPSPALDKPPLGQLELDLNRNP